MALSILPLKYRFRLSNESSSRAQERLFGFEYSLDKVGAESLEQDILGRGLPDAARDVQEFGLLHDQEVTGLLFGVPGEFSMALFLEPEVDVPLPLEEFEVTVVLRFDYCPP